MSQGHPPSAFFALWIYVVEFLTNAIVMSFEILVSDRVAPYFGSNKYIWASLISAVLAASCVGCFIGGVLADRHPSPRVLGAMLVVGSVYLLLLPSFDEPVLQLFARHIDDIRFSGLAATFAIMFFPVMLLGISTPFAIRLLLCSERNSGVVSGTVFGVSMAGSILGVLGAPFLLMPLIGPGAMGLMLGILGILVAAVLIGQRARRPAIDPHRH